MGKKVDRRIIVTFYFGDQLESKNFSEEIYGCRRRLMTGQGSYEGNGRELT